MSFPQKHHFSDSRLKRSFARPLYKKIITAHKDYENFTENIENICTQLYSIRLGKNHEFTQPIWEFSETLRKQLKYVYSSRNGKKMIKSELSKRRNGKCELCSTKLDHPAKAHIIKKLYYRNKEDNKFYINHPANILMLCGDCHIKLDTNELKSRKLNKLNRTIKRYNKKYLKEVNRDLFLIQNQQRKIDKINSNYKTVLSEFLKSFIKKSIK